MRQLSMVCIVFISFATAAQAEPIISVDTNRIIALARNAICEARDNVEPEELKFSRMTYFRSRVQNSLNVIFDRSPSAEATPTADADLDTTHTKALFTTAIVRMGENGEIQTVTDNEKAVQLLREAERRHKPDHSLGFKRELPRAEDFTGPTNGTGQVWAYEARGRIAELISQFVEAVNKRDLDALQSLVHPAIQLAMSDEQTLAFRELYLRACFQHRYAKDRILHYKPMDKESLATLKDEWPGRWLVDPTVEIMIQNKKASSGRGKRIPVHLATVTRDVWCIVLPIPKKEMVDAYLHHVVGQQKD